MSAEIPVFKGTAILKGIAPFTQVALLTGIALS